jgi:hypothetical protein
MYKLSSESLKLAKIDWIWSNLIIRKLNYDKAKLVSVKAFWISDLIDNWFIDDSKLKVMRNWIVFAVNSLSDFGSCWWVGGVNDFCIGYQFQAKIEIEVRS